MKIHTGENIIDGIVVTVVRRKAKRVIIRVRPSGEVVLNVPPWRATLAQGADFLASKWEWVLRTRKRFESQRDSLRPEPREFTAIEIARLQTMLGELHSLWAARVGEFGVEWKTRRMKTRWGVCNWVKRRITYSEMLADKPREVVEYIVAHEFTHFAIHGHGPRFHALMDARMPDWRERRKRLNGKLP